MNSTVILSCTVFLLYLLLLPTAPEAMFTDPDTYWHIASGDLIRQLGKLPESDQWSFTAGSERWYNISWLWDVIFSYAHQQEGWQGVVMMNTITMAATLSLIFANCLIRSRSGISAFVATMLVPCTLMTCSVRPGHFSEFFIALLMLLLRPISGHTISPCRLLAIPIIMIPWVNIHGGFLVAFFLLGIYALEAIINRDRRLFLALSATALLCLLACLINPYGIHVVTGAFRTISSNVGSIILEWQPLSFSAAHAVQIAYLFLFLTLVVLQPLPLAKSEKWLAYSWLVLGLHSLRHLAIFAVVSAPAIALGLRNTLFIPPATPRPIPKVIVQLSAMASHTLESSKAAVAMGLLCLSVSALLFTPFCARLYRMESFNPLPDLSEEIAYMEKNHPHARLLNSYNLGGLLIFLTHGQIPVFIDGRERTAYPIRVTDDYIAFNNASHGWTVIFDRYHLDGIIVSSSDDTFTDRFTDRKGWHMAFRGRTATIFLRNMP